MYFHLVYELFIFEKEKTLVIKSNFCEYIIYVFTQFFIIEQGGQLNAKLS